MIAVDTNILVRILTNDDPAQAQRALRLLRDEVVWVSRTVLLELAWVLKSLYQRDRNGVLADLRALTGNDAVQIENRDAVSRALDWCAGGMELADALHLAAASAIPMFVTFDESFVKGAAKLGAQPPVREP
jgi:predicted nucleic-acid-binding protein